MIIEHKKIIIGICGGIAAYKVLNLISTLVKHHNQVQVVMTEAATQLVNPNAFRALSKRPVVTSLFVDSSEPVPHIALSDEYDALIIVPATANMIAKAAHGIADDVLSTLLVSFDRPVLFVPAMNTRMWDNPIVKNNISLLKQLNYKFVEPAVGHLACGATGKGRMPEEQIILDELACLFRDQDLAGRTVLITSGGTREYIDDVRYISNGSSGKMGQALAREALGRGAGVILVTTVPTSYDHPQLAVTEVTTADEMFAAVDNHFGACDIFISAAAVADFKVGNKHAGKIKKDRLQGEALQLTLVPNPDILRTMAEKRTPGQFVVGFSLEADKLRENAQAKLTTKKCNMIVANAPSAIGEDAAEIMILTPKSVTSHKGSKADLSRIIFDAITCEV